MHEPRREKLLRRGLGDSELRYEQINRSADAEQCLKLIARHVELITNRRELEIAPELDGRLSVALRSDKLIAE